MRLVENANRQRGCVNDGGVPVGAQHGKRRPGLVKFDCALEEVDEREVESGQGFVPCFYQQRGIDNF